MARIKDEHRLILITVLAVIAVWTIDAAFDAFVLHEGSFADIFLNVMFHEPFLRIVLTIGFILYGIIIARIVARHNRADATLKKQTAAIENSMDGIAIYTKDDEYAYVNLSYAAINGYARPSELIGKTIKNAYEEKELERMTQVCIPALRKNGRWRGELVAKRKNGSTYFQEASVTMLDDGSRVCIIRDITWRKRSDERLRRSERFLNTIFDSIRDPFCIFDNEFRIIRVNEAYAQLKGMTPDDLIGKKCYEILYNGKMVCEGCIVAKTFQSSDPCAKEKLVKLPDGSESWMEIYTYPILDEGGAVTHTIEYTRDITDRRKSEGEKRRLIEKLEYLSSTDGLTGLMNRRALTDGLTYEMDRAKRYGSQLSLILCDIDNFKDINDTHGHDAGDWALQTISANLKTILRRSDIAGRYGGDEFMIILPETSVKGAENLAEKLLAAVRNTDLRHEMDGKTLSLSMSIGIADLDAANDTIDSFIKRADDAMYASKQGGRDRISSVKPQ